MTTTVRRSPRTRPGRGHAAHMLCTTCRDLPSVDIHRGHDSRTFPEIVGAAEAAEILGIGPTNFAHLRKNRAGGENPFPNPVIQLRCGPIFLRRDVDEFAKTFSPGRSKTAPEKEVASAKNTPVVLVGIREVAGRYNITAGAVTNWATRHADFPEPVSDLAMGRVWELHEIEQWHEERWPTVVNSDAVSTTSTTCSTSRPPTGTGSSTPSHRRSSVSRRPPSTLILHPALGRPEQHERRHDTAERAGRTS